MNNQNQNTTHQKSYKMPAMDSDSGGSSPFVPTDEILMSMLQNRISEMQYDSNFLEQLQLVTQSITPVRRPTEQYLTVANNGTILGATETVTGFPPDSMLMTPV